VGVRRERRARVEEELHRQRALRDSEAGQSEFNEFARDLLENFQEKLEACLRFPFLPLNPSLAPLQWSLVPASLAFCGALPPGQLQWLPPQRGTRNSGAALLSGKLCLGRVLLACALPSCEALS